MEPKIIFEDEDFLVLDKPAGMVVNRAETTKVGETVQEWVESKILRDKDIKILSAKTQKSPNILISQYPNISDFKKRAGIVHRLDKETSGLLLVAKTPAAFENLQGQFKERKVKKKYLALVTGKVAPSGGEIRAPVGRLPWDREKFGVFPGGREAVTKYEILRYYDIKKLGVFSLLELAPETGRTHQIRVHLKYRGWPIVGDFAYAGRKQAREQRKWCPRVFLHAAFLEFQHPTTGRAIQLESVLPPELKRVIEHLSHTP